VEISSHDWRDRTADMPTIQILIIHVIVTTERKQSLEAGTCMNFILITVNRFDCFLGKNKDHLHCISLAVKVS